MDAEAARWLIVDPDGNEVVVEGSIIELCEQHVQAACILAGCPDAFGWTLTNLETGQVKVPERIEERVRAHRDHGG